MTAVEPSGALGWWFGLGRGQRAGVAIVGLVVAINVVLAALGGIVGGEPGGPVSSSFSTGTNGLRGWSELLGRRGHSVVRLRSTLDEAGLDGSETVVVADPQGLSAPDARALVAFVRSGGRLVLVGESTVGLVRAVAGESVSVTSASGTSTTWVPAAEVRSVRRTVGARTAWSTAAGMLPVAGDDERHPTVLVADVGRGRVVAVSDTRTFQNGQLDRADNAALALDVVGPTTRTVVFAESLHGFGRGGLAAIPSSWKWTAVGLAAALVLGMWSAGSRFGAPEPQRRELRPPRLDHVAAVAADLGRVVDDDAQAVQPLVDATRLDLAARVGVAADASPAVLWQAGEAAGLDPSELAALTHPVADPVHALEVGALAARRQQVRHGVVPTDTVPHDPASGGTSP